ncbi:ion channel [Myroides sp. JBRI-B21084]|uniref:potassium channel family protein n=1 Tax=Myroides sp. JBRI-B21084 TaxID=3119977 RepID=UPI0026E3BB05|nr:potassium channel family protein [Paenimyroides cloacae]WKW46831.1 ion channel [Paenimyroides cloacae]
MNSIKKILNHRKYELLLLALIQHLYIGIFVKDIPFYTEVLWPINMLILGFASIGVFIEKGKLKIIIKNILTIWVILLPIILTFFKNIPEIMFILNISYVLFYLFIFIEVFKFLVKPSYINADIISAAACGFFLLIEVFVFMFQIYAYSNNLSFKGINYTSPAHVYMDLVYYCSISLTTIGYGDITPNTYQTKLITSLIGIIGQFYSVVLVGILISKFTNNT